MSILVNAIETALEEPKEKAIEKALKLLGLSKREIVSGGIAKTSLDARRSHGAPHFVHSVWVTLADGEQALAERFRPPQVVLRREQPLVVTPGSVPLNTRPVIVGFGPAGMFAGLLFARYGYRPLILERGAPIDERAAAVETFWKTGKLNTHTNVQFGEGGAGAFSDGKLTTRIGDAKCGFVLQELVRFGAPPEILQKAKPHVGKIGRAHV